MRQHNIVLSILLAGWMAAVCLAKYRRILGRRMSSSAKLSKWEEEKRRKLSLTQEERRKVLVTMSSMSTEVS